MECANLIKQIDRIIAKNRINEKQKKLKEEQQEKLQRLYDEKCEKH